MTSRLIQVRGLTVGWPGQAPLLERIDFDVDSSEIFAILGGSGCGKSTLMRLLIGLETPVEGSVTIAGIGSPEVDAGPPAFGVTFQQGALFGSMTLAENVALPLERWTDLPPDAIDAIVRAKLRLVGLQDAETRLPSELSGGMRKRAAIARAMALEPHLLFLDEPSSGLDPITSAELDALIVTLQRALGLTVVIVTHELGSILSIVDRCVMLDRATRGIIARGPPRELVSSEIPEVHAFFTRTPRGG
ncbi:MAG: ATP-binding cassette domain-containing protein [Polyangiaceae bacterium]|nr:ATP-binding cassette domain-containing protein [Polyangiaceae bacterium]